MDDTILIKGIVQALVDSVPWGVLLIVFLLSHYQWILKQRAA